MKINIKLLTLIIGSVGIIAVVSGFILSYVSEGSNLCDKDGKSYKEFEWDSKRACQCQGKGNGYEKPIWICRSTDAQSQCIASKIEFVHPTYNQSVLDSAKQRCKGNSGLNELGYIVKCQSLNCFEGLTHYNALCYDQNLLVPTVENLETSPDGSYAIFTENGVHYLYKINENLLSQIDVPKFYLIKSISWVMKDGIVKLTYYDTETVDNVCLNIY